jgi:hypothetical protein
MIIYLGTAVLALGAAVCAYFNRKEDKQENI